MTTRGDSFLIQQVIDGNTNAFQFLVLRYQPRIFQCLASYRLAHPIIEELAQETFVRAFKNLRSYRGEKGASFSTWLFVIAKRVALDEMSRAARIREISTQDGRNPNVSTYAECRTPETILQLKWNQNILQTALNQLPDVFRRAVTLAEIAEHSMSEIAVIEKCSVGTVKSRVHRGKEMLRTILLPETYRIRP